MKKPKSKRCTKCSKRKVLKKFPVDKRMLNGRSSWCRQCAIVSIHKRRAENPVEVHAADKIRRKANSEKIAVIMKAWYKANTKSAIARCKIWQGKNKARVTANHKAWRRANKGKCAAYTRAHQAAKLNAVPPWLTEKDFEAIDRVYIKVAKLGLTVDHIVPLRGRIVCGLHVPWNLRPLSKSANSKKGHHRWPDMPQAEKTSKPHSRIK